MNPYIIDDLRKFSNFQILGKDYLDRLCGIIYRMAKIDSEYLKEAKIKQYIYHILVNILMNLLEKDVVYSRRKISYDRWIRDGCNQCNLEEFDSISFILYWEYGFDNDHDKLMSFSETLISLRLVTSFFKNLDYLIQEKKLRLRINDLLASVFEKIYGLDY